MANESVAFTEPELIRKRGAIKAKLTAFIKFVNDFDTTVTSGVHQLRLRLAKIEQDFTSFESIQNELELLASDEIFEQRLNERCETEELFVSYIAQAQHLLESIDGSRRAESQQLNANNDGMANTNSTGPLIQPSTSANPHLISQSPLTVASEMHVQVPRMHLPKFSGSYEAWPGFADTFRSAIHDNPNFRDTQKLNYLRSCLTGKAAEKIESLETTAANYTVAWRILEEYYNDPAIIINKRIQVFFELPSCNRFNSDSLGELVDLATKHYRALQALNVEFLESFPIYAIISKLDEASRLKWKEHTQGTALPTMEDLLAFLKLRRKLHESNREKSCKSVASSQIRSEAKTQVFSRPRVNSNVAYTVTDAVCSLCQEKHFTSNCPKIRNIPIERRFEVIKNAGLCINCLRPNHTAQRCLAGSCKQCKGRHHTLLHKERKTDERTTNNQADATSMNTGASSSQGREPITQVDGSVAQVNVVSLNANFGSEILMSTAVVHLADNNGRPQPCRMLLDSGSQAHFISESTARRLGLPRQKTAVPVIGINKGNTTIKHSIQTTMQSRINQFQVQATFLVIPQITEALPSHTIFNTDFNIPKNLPLADPSFHISSEVDGLIGAELFYQLLCVGQVKIANHSVTLQKTKLGWIVAGRISNDGITRSIHCNVAHKSVQDQIAKFWELEEPCRDMILSKEERKTEQHFVSNTTRDSGTGRYIVRLPFKEDPPSLGDSYAIACKRFQSLEKRFASNIDLRNKYAEFLDEYIQLGHMSLSNSSATTDGYYLPHHAIIKQSSLTTKLRVVFDASAKTSNGVSLNDNLLTGPTIQDDLYSLLVRFRSHSYVLTADIEKMYRQVLIHPDDRKYQQILWRKYSTDPISTYTLNTVTYGTSAAPHLAVRTLHQLALDEEVRFPNASRILREDFYVDDLLTGADTHSEVLSIRDELINLCKKGGFNLRQWATNDETLIETLDKTSVTLLRLDLDSTIKTLGISWDAKRDSISYKLATLDQPNRITKRSILSVIASLFDPLGLLGPIIIRAKIIMQQLWKMQLSWDESVPIDIHTVWSKFCSELSSLSNILITRQITLKGYVTVQLHGFCDASEQAYGACIYARSTDQDGRIVSHLISAKSRVAPLKTVTLPRLELCAAHLLARLFKTTKLALRRITFERITFWSDSTVTLHWIKTSPHLLKTFIAHRVTEIQDMTKNHEWRHVSSSENPADLISRGLYVKDLVHNKLWFHGPTWLTDGESRWPGHQLDSIEIPEMRPVLAFPSRTSNWKFFERFSSYSRLKRTLAYILRFWVNSSHKESNKGILTTFELDRAERYIFRLVQQETLHQEIHNLTNTGHSTGSMAPLNPFIDSEGLLRVGGRLARADLPYNARHPILLPKTHHVTRLIILDQHLKNFHAGIQATLSAIRQRIWIPNGKAVIRNIVRKCIICHRANPPVIEYKMGDLPAGRVSPSKPFKQTGVDFCGPLYIKEKSVRNRNKVKVYLAIFVCFSTKAVHIEIVSDLTTDAFLAALRRFFARRGLSSDIYSDNGTNFVGAKRELKEVYAFINAQTTNEVIGATLANDGINWHTIPPRAPHFGGLWEAAVRRTKFHLIRVVGDTLLSYEALLTFINQTEAILNSRPITPISSDPNDLHALTPGHFLTGECLTSVPDYDYSQTPIGRLSSWQHCQQMRQHFWKRWVKDYLQTQTTRAKWHKPRVLDIPVGTLVILKEDNVPPMQWPLGRITAVHPGDDGIVRVVTVKTVNGEYKRCVKRISPLPLSD